MAVDLNYLVGIGLDPKDFIKGGKLLVENVDAQRRALNSLLKETQRHNRFIRDQVRNIERLVTAYLGLRQVVQAGKVSIQFDDSLTKIVTLVGRSREQVDAWRGDIRRLAVETGVSANDLADALFFVTSAGAENAEAYDILERSARAAAIGMGKVKDVARLVTASLAAYKRQGLDAATATDQLVATVRLGAFEAAELGEAFGRVLGLGSQLDVPLSELGAFVAAYTRLGLKPFEAVTALRGTLSAILKPASQSEVAFRELAESLGFTAEEGGASEDVLTKIGLSIEELRAKVAQNGLAESLLEIVRATGENDEALARIFPRLRALSGVLGTAGAQGKDYAEIQWLIAQSTGVLAEAFAELEKSPAHAARRIAALREELQLTFGTPLAFGFADAFDDLSELEKHQSEIAEVGRLAGEAVELLAKGIVVLAQNSTLVQAALGGLLFSGLQPFLIGTQHLAAVSLALQSSVWFRPFDWYEAGRSVAQFQKTAKTLKFLKGPALLAGGLLAVTVAADRVKQHIRETVSEIDEIIHQTGRYTDELGGIAQATANAVASQNVDTMVRLFQQQRALLDQAVVDYREAREEIEQLVPTVGTTFINGIEVPRVPVSARDPLTGKEKEKLDEYQLKLSEAARMLGLLSGGTDTARIAAGEYGGTIGELLKNLNQWDEQSAGVAGGLGKAYTALLDQEKLLRETIRLAQTYRDLDDSAAEKVAKTLAGDTTASEAAIVRQVRLLGDLQGRLDEIGERKERFDSVRDSIAELGTETDGIERQVQLLRDLGQSAEVAGAVGPLLGDLTLALGELAAEGEISSLPAQLADVLGIEDRSTVLSLDDLTTKLAEMVGKKLEVEQTAESISSVRSSLEGLRTQKKTLEEQTKLMLGLGKSADVASKVAPVLREITTAIGQTGTGELRDLPDWLRDLLGIQDDAAVLTVADLALALSRLVEQNDEASELPTTLQSIRDAVAGLREQGDELALAEHLREIGLATETATQAAPLLRDIEEALGDLARNGEIEQAPQWLAELLGVEEIGTATSLDQVAIELGALIDRNRQLSESLNGGKGLGELLGILSRFSAQTPELARKIGVLEDALDLDQARDLLARPEIQDQLRALGLTVEEVLEGIAEANADVTSRMGKDWDAVADGVSSALRDLADSSEGSLSLLSSALAQAIEQFRQLQQQGASKGQAGLAASLSGLAVLLNGQGEGNYSAELGAIGAIVGTFFGGVGGSLGQAIGSVLGAVIKKGADDGIAYARQVGDDIAAHIGENQGGLGVVAQKLVRAYADAISQLEDRIGAQLETLGVRIHIRGDKIFVDVGTLRQQFNNEVDALNYAITSAVNNLQFVPESLSENVRAALESGQFNSIDELEQTLDVAQAVDDFKAGIGDLALKMREESQWFRQAERAAIEHGISLRDLIALERELLSKRREGVLASADSLIGISSEANAVRDLLQARRDYNAGLDAEQQARVAKLESLRRQLAATEKSTEEGTTELLDRLQRTGAGLSEEGDKLADINEKLGGSFGKLGKKTVDGLDRIESLKDAIAALEEGLDDVPEKIALEEILNGIAAAGIRSFDSLYAMLERVWGREAFSAERRRLAQDLYILQLGAQLAAIIAMEEATEGLITVPETLKQRVQDTINTLESGARSLDAESSRSSSGGNRRSRRETALEQLAAMQRLADGIGSAVDGILDQFRERVATAEELRKLGNAEEAGRAAALNLQLTADALAELLDPNLDPSELAAAATQLEALLGHVLPQGLRDLIEEALSALPSTDELRRLAGVAAADELLAPWREALRRSTEAESALREIFSGIAAGLDEAERLASEHETLDLGALISEILVGGDAQLDDEIGDLLASAIDDGDVAAAQELFDLLASLAAGDLSGLDLTDSALEDLLPLLDSLGPSLSDLASQAADAITQIEEARQSEARTDFDEFVGGRRPEIIRGLSDFDARVNELADKLRAAGLPADELVDKLAQLARIRVDEQMTAARTFLQELQQRGVALPVEVVQALALAEAEEARAKAILTAQTLASTGALLKMGLSLDRFLLILTEASFVTPQATVPTGSSSSSSSSNGIDEVERLLADMARLMQSWAGEGLGSQMSQLAQFETEVLQILQRAADLQVDTAEFLIAAEERRQGLIEASLDSLSSGSRTIDDLTGELVDKFADVHAVLFSAGASAEQWAEYQVQLQNAIADLVEQVRGESEELLARIHGEQTGKDDASLNVLLEQFRQAYAQALATGDLDAIGNANSLGAQLLELAQQMEGADAQALLAELESRIGTLAGFDVDTASIEQQILAASQAQLDQMAALLEQAAQTNQGVGAGGAQAQGINAAVAALTALHEGIEGGNMVTALHDLLDRQGDNLGLTAEQIAALQTIFESLEDLPEGIGGPEIAQEIQRLIEENAELLGLDGPVAQQLAEQILQLTGLTQGVQIQTDGLESWLNNENSKAVSRLGGIRRFTKESTGLLDVLLGTTQGLVAPRLLDIHDELVDLNGNLSSTPPPSSFAAFNAPPPAEVVPAPPPPPQDDEILKSLQSIESRLASIEDRLADDDRHAAAQRARGEIASEIAGLRESTTFLYEEIK